MERMLVVDPFTWGDVVMLKSSPDRKMTVFARSSTLIYCDWMDERGQLQNGKFYPQELTHESD